MNPKTITNKKIEVKEKVVKEHNLILFNDDVNTFEHVIELLIKICDHDAIQAEQCATLVHFSGKCAVKKGEYAVLEIMSGILADNGLTVEIN
ncbi:MAG: Clp protease ClpS [Bacteroidetes bacterium RIFCSPLOWO2_12_FULL_31_6]|nr:MAG: Clp protease ClpS [Bacteroidetes bacterium RIFCSPLOWO2_12_FULL_31_6]